MARRNFHGKLSILQELKGTVFDWQLFLKTLNLFTFKFITCLPSSPHFQKKRKLLFSAFVSVFFFHPTFSDFISDASQHFEKGVSEWERNQKTRIFT